MKRFRQRLFNGFTALSLLYCIATAVLWVRSSSHCDTFEFLRNAKTLTIANAPLWEVASVETMRVRRGWSQIYLSDLAVAGVEDGRFFWGRSSKFRPHIERGIHYVDLTYGEGPHLQVYMLQYFNPPPYSVRYHWGFETLQIRVGSLFDSFTFIPMWLIAAVTAILPLWWALPFSVRGVRQILEHRKRRNGFCIGCGYDLRATPNQCPECGTIPSTKA
jgi:hypothetical protein